MSPLSWQRSIEQIVLTATNERNRVLGLTSVRRGAGVSLIARHVARTMVSSGSNTLLVDISEPKAQALGSDLRQVSSATVRESITATAYGYDLLAASNEESRRALYGNLPRLRELLRAEFSDYDRIVIDMPPIFDAAETGFNAVAAAAICDRLLLVCAIGIDKRADVESVVSLLKGAGVSLAGIVSNEFERVDARDEMARYGLMPRR